jgi:hypothetical protein
VTRAAALLAAAALAIAGCPAGEPPTEPGTLVLVIPADGATGVPVTQDVTGQWTAPVDGVAFAVRTAGTEVVGVRNRVGDGSVWAWLPDGDFAPDTPYEVTLTWTGATAGRTFSFVTAPEGDDDDSAADDDSAD